MAFARRRARWLTSSSRSTAGWYSVLMTRTTSATTASASTLDLTLLGVAILAVSTSGPLIREADAPAMAVAFWRTFLACLVILPFAALRHRHELRSLQRNEVRTAAAAGGFLALHFATWVPSLSF